MDLSYSYAESTIKPSVVEMGADNVYLRKDFVEVVRSNEQGGTTTYWTYQEAKMSRERFNDYASAILISGQKIGDDNQLIVMEAIADLYEAIAGLMT